MLLALFILAPSLFVLFILFGILYRKLTPVIADMRALENTDITFLQWNDRVFNPALRRAFYSGRDVKVIRYADDKNRGGPNDKFIINEDNRLMLTPLPKVHFK